MRIEISMTTCLVKKAFFSVSGKPTIHEQSSDFACSEWTTLSLVFVSDEGTIHQMTNARPLHPNRLERYFVAAPSFVVSSMRVVRTIRTVQSPGHQRLDCSDYVEL